MELTLHPQTQWTPEQGTTNVTIWSKCLAMLDKQGHNQTLWYIVSLIVQGILFLPVTAAMIFYFNAPTVLLTVSLGLYFANIIAGMGGAGIRVILSLFILSVITHLSILAFYTL